MEKLLKPEEAAANLAVSRKTIRLWLANRKLIGVRVGRLWRISVRELDEFVKRSTAANPSQGGGK